MTKCPKCGEIIYSLTEQGEKALEDLGYPKTKVIDFEPEWEKIKKEYHKRTDRINAFKELWRARSELVLAELVSGIKRKEKP